MKITVTIDKRQVSLVKDMAKEVSGRKPTKEELVEFFTKDVEGLYGDTFKDNLEDAVECHFG